MNCLKGCMPLICVTLISAPVQAEGIKKTAPLYDDKDIYEAITLQPQKYITKRDGLLGTALHFPGNYRHVSLFPVPLDNAVGTNDMGNALTTISFHKGKMSYKRYFKDAVYDVCCGGNYMSNAVPGLVGFGQGGRFVLYDLKRKTASNYHNLYAEKIVVADAEKRRFLFGDNNNIELIDLSGNEPELITKIANPLGTVWSASSDRIFMWEYKAKKLRVFDLNLEPADHPLEEVIARYNDKIGFMRMAIHPDLPFAILYNGIEGNFVVSWGKGRDKAPPVLVYDGEDFTFSPDGKWVVYKTGNIGQNSHTYMMPISETYTNFVGSPIFLTDDYFNHYAWTTNPTAFVGSSIETINRWDLESCDFPSKGGISFHDFIVQQDLERLDRKNAEGTPIDKAERLIASKTNLNAKDNKGYTALLKAAMYGYTDAVNLLIKAGADITIKDAHGHNALRLAAASGHEDIVKLLMGTERDLHYALKDAATYGHSGIVKLLIAAGANVNSQPGRESPLSQAISWRHVETVKLLIAANANVNARFGYDNIDTPLRTAIGIDRPDIVKLLIEAKVDVNEKYFEGESALMYAAKEKHLEIVKLLIASGADVNYKDGSGINRVLRAAGYDQYARAYKGYNQEVIDVLVKSGAK